MSTFPQNVIELENLRKQIQQKGANWIAGETSITKLKSEVIAGLFSKVPFGPVSPAKPLTTPLPILPSSFDWTNDNGINYVTSVKDQKGESICTAYASAAALETCVVRAGFGQNLNIDLAEHAISCSSDGGCGNLHAIAAFMQATGLPPEDRFADCAHEHAGWQLETYKVKIWDCFYPTKVDEAKALLVQNGPVVTTMNCPSDFSAYKGGIYSNTTDSSGGFHAVLLVGYDDLNQCFKVKNSWGTDWGELGYFRIAYSEFKSSGVNFGWDIHTYAGAVGPAVAAKTLQAGRNADGRLEIFYTGTDDKLYHNAQVKPNGAWGGSAALGGWGKQLVVGQNADGRLEVFYIGTDDKLYHNAQVKPNSTWGGEAALGGWGKQLAVGQNADGRLEVFYIGTDDKLYHNAQVKPNGAWGGEAALGGWGKQLVVGQNADGRLEVFYIGTDDKLYHNAQVKPNSTWGGEAALGGWGKQLVVRQNADGRLEVFYIGTDNKLYHNAQVKPNSTWGGKAALGGWGKQLVVGQNADGRLEVFYVGTDDKLYHNAQIKPNSTWGGEAALGGWGKQLAVGQNADGRLEVFYVGTDDKLYHNAQVKPNSTWGGEARLC